MAKQTTTQDQHTTVTNQKTRSYGINDIINWKFEDQDMPKEWIDLFGNLPKRWSMYVDGSGGSCKTEFVMRLAQMLAIHVGKTHINNVEQGKHRQIKESTIRNNFKGTIKAGKFIYSIIPSFSDYVKKIKSTNSGLNQIIDSISQWKVSEQEVMTILTDKKLKKKNFVFVAYKKHRARNAEIMHLCDIKIELNEGIASLIGSRFGGGIPLDVHPNHPERNKKSATPHQPNEIQNEKEIEHIGVDEGKGQDESVTFIYGTGTEPVGVVFPKKKSMKVKVTKKGKFVFDLHFSDSQELSEMLVIYLESPVSIMFNKLKDKSGYANYIFYSTLWEWYNKPMLLNNSIAHYQLTRSQALALLWFLLDLKLPIPLQNLKDSLHQKLIG